MSIAALLLLAATASASLSPWLVLAGAWAALIVGVMAGVNWYRSRVEQQAIHTGQATRFRTAVHGPIRSPISGAGALGWPVKGKAVDELREWPEGVPKRSEDSGAWPVIPSVTERRIATIYERSGRLVLRRRSQ